MSKNDNPLEVELDESEDEAPLESKADLLARYVGSRGFRPKEPRQKDTIEYVKTYSDPTGKLGRAVLVVSLDEVGLDPKRPEYVAVTVQSHIKATLADVTADAPPFCRQDLIEVLQHFDTYEERSEEAVECVLCGKVTADFVQRGTGYSCMDCLRRKGPK